MQDQLAHYIKSISRMRTDAGKSKYPDTTLHRAPHKPILLLAILDMFEQGELTSNFVPISPQLADLFVSYWELIMPTDREARLFLPFFHLKNDGFWHLIPHHGQETALESMPQIGGAGQLREMVLGGQFDSELYELICINETRHMLRAVVIETYFSEAMQIILIEQARTNAIAHHYSLELLDNARKQSANITVDEDENNRPIRDQGFRKAIVIAYDHRCVFCGIRLVTYEGRTVATAAHIIPWSISHNDDPRNGVCLCRLCHWSFDVGLASITAKYRIRLSSQVNAEGNVPGHLSTLNERPIFEPIEEAFNPDVDALNWHMRNVLLG